MITIILHSCLVNLVSRQLQKAAATLTRKVSTAHVPTLLQVFPELIINILLTSECKTYLLSTYLHTYVIFPTGKKQLLCKTGKTEILTKCSNNLQETSF